MSKEGKVKSQEKGREKRRNNYRIVEKRAITEERREKRGEEREQKERTEKMEER